MPGLSVGPLLRELVFGVLAGSLYLWHGPQFNLSLGWREVPGWGSKGSFLLEASDHLVGGEA